MKARDSCVIQKLDLDCLTVVTSFLDWQDCARLCVLDSEWSKQMKQTCVWPLALDVNRLPFWEIVEDTDEKDRQTCIEFLGRHEGKMVESTPTRRVPNEIKMELFFEFFAALQVPLHTLILQDKIRWGGLSSIRHMPLQTFHWYNATFDPTDLKYLSAKPLTSLCLKGFASLRDVDLRYFSSCTELKELNLSSTPIFGYGFKYLVKTCKQLSCIHLDHADIVDEHMPDICQLPLKTLSINRTSITDISLPLLKNIPDLSIRGVQFTLAAMVDTWPEKDKADLIKMITTVQSPKVRITGILWEAFQ
jgi:hypothetical protein